MDKNKLENLKANYKETPIPKELDSVVKHALKTKNPGRPRFVWIAGIAAAAVLFTTTLNLNPAFAKSLENVPVVGSIVQVLTIKEYSVDEENYQADIKVPAVDKLEDPLLEQRLNEKYLAESQELYETFMKEMEAQQAFDTDGHLKLDNGYVIKTETEQLLSIGRYVEETVGSSMTTIQYDTIDKQNQVLVTLPGLFKDTSYIEVISANIIEQMQTQMEEDPSKIYWIDSVEQPDPNGFKVISADQNFYINANHKLVISFNEFDVAPGYMGPVEFTIPTEELQAILVSDEYLK